MNYFQKNVLNTHHIIRERSVGLVQRKLHVWNDFTMTSNIKSNLDRKYVYIRNISSPNAARGCFAGPKEPLA